ncbi:MAG: DNA polymerase III subunit beta [Anaerolineae bacterium]|nr:DNA polymerase III subunit beta [Anaerolineae bacterium]MDH7475491.1 DNA polymerase III subunit beta [Anaerolineae bacterium]
MRVSCLQENLAKGLSIVNRAVATRSTLPVLSNVLLATEQGLLKLAATDLELAISCWIGAKVEEDGETTVPARLLTDLVNSLPPERIDMELVVRTQALHLTCARNEADLKVVDASEFPLLPAATGEHQIALPPETLRQMIGQVAFAAATDESRPILTGVLADFSGDKLTLAAADGFRLSVRSAPLGEVGAEPISVVIPARALSELSRIAAEEEAPITMTITPGRNQVLFHLQGNAGALQGKVFGIDLISQLLEGRFPDYNQLIPKTRHTRTILNTGEFLKACRMANIFARSEANIIRLSVAPDHMTIYATSAEMGDSVSEIDAHVEGDPIIIAFNAKYLIDVLSVVDSAQVALETTTASSPGVIRPVGDETFTHVIMPMHIRTESANE